MPVALPPGCARLRAKPLSTGSFAAGNTIGIVRVLARRGQRSLNARRKDEIRFARDKIGRESGQARLILVGINAVIHDVATFHPTQLAHGIRKYLSIAACLCRADIENTDANWLSGARRRLRAREGGVERCQPDQKPAPCVHSITLSARTRTICGIVSPSALAIFRFTTRLKVVGCSMGKSPGFAPLKILSTSAAARRLICAKLGP